MLTRDQPQAPNPGRRVISFCRGGDHRQGAVARTKPTGLSLASRGSQDDHAAERDQCPYRLQRPNALTQEAGGQQDGHHRVERRQHCDDREPPMRRRERERQVATRVQHADTDYRGDYARWARHQDLPSHGWDQHERRRAAEAAGSDTSGRPDWTGDGGPVEQDEKAANRYCSGGRKHSA
jgi:hypothetical protein